MIDIKSVLISPNPVDQNTVFTIAVDVADIIEYLRWSDMKTMTWAQLKLMTWDEISAYRNPENNIQSVVISGDFISGQDLGDNINMQEVI